MAPLFRPTPATGPTGTSNHVLQPRPSRVRAKLSALKALPHPCASTLPEPKTLNSDPIRQSDAGRTQAGPCDLLEAVLPATLGGKNKIRLALGRGVPSAVSERSHRLMRCGGQVTKRTPRSKTARSQTFGEARKTGGPAFRWRRSPVHARDAQSLSSSLLFVLHAEIEVGPRTY